MRSTDRQGLWTRLGTQVQALQTHYRYPLHFHQRMECGHIMIDLATKGGPTSVQRKPDASLSIQRRPETNESRVRPLNHILRMEVHYYEDPVNPRGSRDCSFTMYFGMG